MSLETLVTNLKGHLKMGGVEMKILIVILFVITICGYFYYSNKVKDLEYSIELKEASPIIMNNTIIEFYDGRIYLYPKEGFEYIDPITWGQPKKK